MPKRMQAREYELAYEMLSHRDGRVCLKCWGERRAINHGNPRKRHPLEIDHINGDRTDSSPGNIGLLCMHCNNQMRRWAPLDHRRMMLAWREAVKEMPPAERFGASAHCPKNVCVSQKEGGGIYENKLKRVVDYTNGPMESQVNLFCEEDTVQFYFDTIRQEGNQPKDDLESRAALFKGCNIVTAARYLKPHICSDGALTTYLDKSLNKVMVRFKTAQELAELEARKNKPQGGTDATK